MARFNFHSVSCSLLLKALCLLKRPVKQPDLSLRILWLQLKFGMSPSIHQNLLRPWSRWNGWLEFSGGLSVQEWPLFPLRSRDCPGRELWCWISLLAAAPCCDPTVGKASHPTPCTHTRCPGPSLGLLCPSSPGLSPAAAALPLGSSASGTWAPRAGKERTGTALLPPEHALKSHIYSSAPRPQGDHMPSISLPVVLGHRTKELWACQAGTCLSFKYLCPVPHFAWTLKNQVFLCFK